MIAYKAFRPGLICLGYQFVMGMNVTDKSKLPKNGFHSAENPLIACRIIHLKTRNSIWWTQAAT